MKEIDTSKSQLIAPSLSRANDGDGHAAVITELHPEMLPGAGAAGTAWGHGTAPGGVIASRGSSIRREETTVVWPGKANADLWQPPGGSAR